MFTKTGTKREVISLENTTLNSIYTIKRNPLAFFNPSFSIEISVEPSPVGLGAVLTQNSLMALPDLLATQVVHSEKLRTTQPN